MRRALLATDLVAVLAFVVIGRANHHHGLSAAGLSSTAWPFLVGLCCGWLVLVASRTDPKTLLGTAIVSVLVVFVAMVLRVLAGQGTAPAFVVVAAVFFTLTIGAARIAARAIGPTRRNLA